MNRTVGNIVGIDKNVGEAIPAINLPAWAISSARKKIHANTVKQKVTSIAMSSLNDGNDLPFATISRLFLFVLKMIDGIINSAFKNPQTMKFQLAPCQNPLTRNMINVFLIFINKPPLLPPNGIYK